MATAPRPRRWTVDREVRRIISTASPDAQVARDPAGRPVAIVIPSGHPAFREVCGILGAHDPDELAAVEQLARFVRSELFHVEGRAGRYVLLRVDVLQSIFESWCETSGERVLVPGCLFASHLEGLGMRVAQGKLYGYTLKDDALHDGFRRDTD